MPDFSAVADRLASLSDHVQLNTLDTAEGLPIYSAPLNPAATQSSIWINAGTHGDEPAPVEASLSFLESWNTDRFSNTLVLVTPCLNPSGYSRGTRENADGLDLNWAFMREDVVEIQVVRDIIKGRRFSSVIDLHEDWESPGYYVYEMFRDREPLGRTITERVGQHCPVNHAAEIEGEPADHGVIYPSLEAIKRKNGTGVPVEVFNRATDHQVTSESPSGRPMEERVKAHLVTIEVFLERYGVG